MKNNFKQIFPLFVLWGFLLLVVVGLLAIIIPMYGKVDFESLLVDSISTFIASCGFAIVIYKVYEKQKDFLDTKIDVYKLENSFYIRTQVLNKSGLKKEIKYALLFISDQEENPVDMMNEFMTSMSVDIRFDYTNEFDKLKEYFEFPHHQNDKAIIPLPFYYSENVWIANESPAFTYAFNPQNEKLADGIYSVRFFIFWNNGLHRSTADSLVIGNKGRYSSLDRTHNNPNNPKSNIN